MAIKIVHRRALNGIAVANASELATALAAATGGERLLLAAGNYGVMPAIPSGLASEIVIESADTGNPAIFTSFSNRFQSKTNITLRSLSLQFTTAGGADTEKPFQINLASNIWIDGCLVVGDLATGTGGPADGYPTGYAIWVYYCSNVRVTNCEVHTWRGGVNFFNSSNCEMSGCNIHNIRNDGLDCVTIDGMLIEGNWFHDFADSGANPEHKDAIQFWTVSEVSPSVDVVIRGNLIDVGAGQWMQSIFMGNEAVAQGAGAEMYYQNVLIEQNVIINNHLHGITIGPCNGLTIRDNSVLYHEADIDPQPVNTTGTPQILVFASTTGTRVITGNIVKSITIDTSYGGIPGEWTTTGNVLVDPADYGTIFTAPSIADRTFVEIAPSGAGAPREVYDLAG